MSGLQDAGFKFLLTCLSKLLPPGLFTVLLVTVLSVFRLVKGWRQQAPPKYR